MVLRDVPPHATAVGVPAKVVSFRQPDGTMRRVENLPDPEGDMISALRRKVFELEERMGSVESALGDALNENDGLRNENATLRGEPPRERHLRGETRSGSLGRVLPGADTRSDRR